MFVGEREKERKRQINAFCELPKKKGHITSTVKLLYYFEQVRKGNQMTTSLGGGADFVNTIQEVRIYQEN